MIRCKVGTGRRRAITFSSTDEHVEVHIDSIIELLRFTGVALAAIRVGMGDDGAAEVPGGSGAGTEESAVDHDRGERAAEDVAEGSAQAGVERDIYISYRSFRIQVT